MFQIAEIKHRGREEMYLTQSYYLWDVWQPELGLGTFAFYLKLKTLRGIELLDIEGQTLPEVLSLHVNARKEDIITYLKILYEYGLLSFEQFLGKQGKGCRLDVLDKPEGVDNIYQPLQKLRSWQEVSHYLEEKAQPNALPTHRPDLASLKGELLSKELKLIVQQYETLFQATPTIKHIELYREFLEEHRFQLQYLMAFLELCATKSPSHGKASYQRAILEDQLAKGITTVREMENNWESFEKIQAQYYQIRKRLGLPTDRSVIQGEKDVFHKWLHNWGFSIEVIFMAVDWAVRMGKSQNIAYVDKILETWNSKGVRTSKDAQEIMEQGRRERRAYGQADQGYRKVSNTSPTDAADKEAYYKKLLGD